MSQYAFNRCTQMESLTILDEIEEEKNGYKVFHIASK